MAVSPSVCSNLLFPDEEPREAQWPERPPVALGPHLFRLTIEAFCPALFKTSFHSSSSPRMTYLKKLREISRPAPNKRGLLETQSVTASSLMGHVLPQRREQQAGDQA